MWYGHLDLAPQMEYLKKICVGILAICFTTLLQVESPLICVPKITRMIQRRLLLLLLNLGALLNLDACEAWRGLAIRDGVCERPLAASRVKQSAFRKRL